MRHYGYTFSIINGLIFLFSFFPVATDPLVYTSLVVCVLMVLEKLGRGIVLRELIALFNSFIYLFMPLMGYLFYTRTNFLAANFLRYMPVAKEEYYSLALPATSGFIFLLCLPLDASRGDFGSGAQSMFERVKNQLAGNHKLGFRLMFTGVLVDLLLVPFVPAQFRYVLILFVLSSYVGVLYLYFSDYGPAKNIYLGAFAILVLFNSLQSGMFTIIAYMGMTIFSFLLLNRRLAFWKKLLAFFLGVFVLIIIQSIKQEYRMGKAIRGMSNNERFLFLIGNKLQNADQIFTIDFMWPIYYRANQGYYVAMVQNHIPRVRPFDNGKKLGLVFASAFVPRLLWPDKPKSGGYENMLYYAGFKLRGYTMNVGPLGEGYGSFGKEGAIAFMLFLGLLIRYFYARVFRISQTMPLVVLWIPLIFYEVSYAGENDTLQIVNSLLKTSLFTYGLFKLFPRLFISRPRRLTA